MNNSKKEIEELDRKYKRMDDSVREVIMLFGEDPSKVTAEDFFKIVSTFSQLFMVYRLIMYALQFVDASCFFF